MQESSYTRHAQKLDSSSVTTILHFRILPTKVTLYSICIERVPIVMRQWEIMLKAINKVWIRSIISPESNGIYLSYWTVSRILSTQSE